ncbi:glucosidase [Desertifilum sp. FACHB-1129]|uniref:Glucosidase n=1 Tax=Desertifilum tharense IPPAS B-1220 TaxID=1781255 RepID=A0A1E5QCR0_9CYAN|nr:MULTISPECIES: glucosidase [Desertifilum]MDA0210891.1 glucosidase [Cyanobacteria bacterium FC1]MBD2312124.1 glucosidase [Desertifilum sp. FACHB-1129]MBD2322214.1 glucosidase [Desertifilum sp. FACHB-866]MBD2332251.1 glucosidase [Desertifilum sp. FACHB-868]OEJ72391.1 glucosidase [Desertifilum tharense IPPAS B-1220]
MTAEEQRLAEHREHQAHWHRWGPYLSERQWGTVREDYSTDGSAWSYFPHDHARSRAYRWGEDGIGGISDNHQRLCFAIALWNEADPILKERMFGLSGPEGNHGEDVKDYYFYLDNTPTHAYMKFLYKYPQKAFPYQQLVEENQRLGYDDPEFELGDTGIFEGDRYFDVFVEYAKASDEDILIQIQVINRGPEAKPLHLLPTLWFRNTWSWFPDEQKPLLKVEQADRARSKIAASHPTLGDRWLYCQAPDELLFTENETNSERLFNTPNASPYVKDGINQYIVEGKTQAVNPDGLGTKFSGHYTWTIQPGESKTIRLRLCDTPELSNPFGEEFERVFKTRKQEADEFYHKFCPNDFNADQRLIQRQAFAGLLWTKQFYHYVVEEWIKGDPAHPNPDRDYVRNPEWIHLYNDDIISMPDKWEFPWYAAWDLAFHVVPFAVIDPDFAKRQLDRLTREWYMHPNGQLPAYEWHFSDVNPPVHAWGALKVYQIEKEIYGKGDRHFLETVFQKLLMNFTWWVNRKDEGGNNVFQGGFLGLDNIGLFDRSAELPTGGHLDQSDGTSWMGMYSLNMLSIALELAPENPAYEDMASKFFEHFLYIADAMNHFGETDINLWDEKDGFYYDVLQCPHGARVHLKIRSMVGLVPLFAVSILKQESLEKLPNFKRRLEWFIDNRPDLRRNVANLEQEGKESCRILSIVSPHKLRKILEKMLDESEFLSDYGIRSLSRFHATHPYTLKVEDQEYHIAYEAAESTSGMFGGNSNWRGPIWFPMNYLLIEALEEFYSHLGDEFKVECPTGSGQSMTLAEVSHELAKRLAKIFALDEQGYRAVYGKKDPFQNHPDWRDYILFHEYFNGDTGAGLGANHQTGWTALVAQLLHI